MTETASARVLTLPRRRHKWNGRASDVPSAGPLAACRHHASAWRKSLAPGCPPPKSGFFKSFEKAFDPKKIFAPGRRLVLCDEPAHFQRWLAPVGKHGDLGKPARTVGRIAIDSQVAGNLTMRGEIGCNDRRSNGERLDNRQTKAFGEGRHQQSLGMRNEPTECRARQPPREDYAIAECPASLHRIQHRTGTPTRQSDYDEVWGVLASLSDQLAPDVQKQMMVFAGLDCSAHDKVIVLTQLLVGPVTRKEYRGNRERHSFDWDRVPTAQTERMQYSFARCRRRCDQPGCILRRTVDDPPMPTLIFAGNQFRSLKRDHVVKHEHRFDIRSLSKPGNNPRNR